MSLISSNRSEAPVELLVMAFSPTFDTIGKIDLPSEPILILFEWILIF